MELDPVVIQGMITAPITLGLVFYTLTRKDRSLLHTQLAAILSLVVVWMVCLILGKEISPDSGLRRVAFHAEMLSTAVMAPLFLIIMGGLSRVNLFERSRRATVSLVWMCAFISLLYLSDSYHHLFFADIQAALRNEHPLVWGGPGYWVLQLFCCTCSAAAVGLGVMMAWRGRTPDERNRALMVLGATAIPLVAHLIYVKGLLPIDFSLAPGTIGVTAYFFVKAIGRYGFIIVRPVMRQDVIEHMGDGILLADPQGIVLDANAAAERTLDCARHGLRGQSLASALSPLDSTTGRRRVGERIIELPLEGGRFREEVRTSDGRSIEITVGAVGAVDSQSAGRFVSLRDRSELRRSERLLQQRQKLESIGIMAAGVAHEVNNPLAYVRSNLVHLQELSTQFTEELKLRASEPGSDLLEFPEILEESVAGLDRIAETVKGMLRFSRPSSEDVEAVDVNTVVEEALQLSALHENRSVRVERQLDADLPQIEVSAQGLVQVVLNLLLNAKQALADQRDGHVLAQTRRVQGAIEIVIEDNSPGIADEDLQRIFDPFFSTRDPGQGTGLGLSIAFDIVRNQGGELAYTSVESGGARFVVRLELPEESIAAGAAA